MQEQEIVTNNETSEMQKKLEEVRESASGVIEAEAALRESYEKLRKRKSELQHALDALAAGKPIIVVDQLDRENEGDLVISGQMANIENINFAIRNAGGLMCLPTTKEILSRLQVPMMVEKTNDPLETPFTVSVDAAHGTTGVSVHDRLKTIEILLKEDSEPHHLKRPGHLFPLRAREGLLQERQGHTEASIELMKLIGHKPLAIIVEIMNDDGTMAKGEDLVKYADKHKLHIIEIQDIYDAVYNKGV
jgi:3,4-dihydroxy 2-butanone 4-phosphate synthase / GTP cyclohydrolase II